MYKKLNNFFSIDNNDYQKLRKERLHQNSRIEKYRSEIL